MAKKDEAAESAAAPKKDKKKLIIIAVVALVALGGAYKFVLAPKPTAAAAKPAPKPGAVLTLDPVNVNLADGHYLKVGFTLQATSDAGEEVADGAKALDSAINIFSGQDITALEDKKQLAKVKQELLKEVEKRYDAKVMDIYYTTFVVQ